jgi:simple sugar transport system ATP-binding protein
VISSLILDRVSKVFGNVTANDNVSIRIDGSTVHAILGENGAGKSTLMNILYGLYQPDEGRILINDREVNIHSPRQALEHGIGMVHQHLTLVGPLSVTENIILGLKERQVFINKTEHGRRIRELAESFGFDINPDALIWQLPMGKQQQVEILKLLYRNAEVLILDEPTSVLTPSETQPFFDVLERLKKAGKTIIFITHKLDEVMRIADKVTVMGRGQVVAEVETAVTSPRELARLMIGRDVVLDIKREDIEFGDVVLEIEDLSAVNDRGLEALDCISLNVRKGEIVGIAGVDGNGQAELAEIIAGLRDSQKGCIRIDGKDITGASVAERNRVLKVGYVPEDRQRVGLDLDQSVATNLVLRSYDNPPFARLQFLNFDAIERNAERLVEKYDVRLGSINQKTRFLSGGNQQKLILAREIEANPVLLVVAQPCKGLDIGAIEFVQKTLLEQRKEGAGILYISSELEHILAVCDRIAVISAGRITGVLTPEEATSERLGMLMAGAKG